MKPGLHLNLNFYPKYQFPVAFYCCNIRIASRKVSHSSRVDMAIGIFWKMIFQRRARISNIYYNTYNIRVRIFRFDSILFGGKEANSIHDTFVWREVYANRILIMDVMRASYFNIRSIEGNVKGQYFLKEKFWNWKKNV